jgi:hypothetical protein
MKKRATEFQFSPLMLELDCKTEMARRRRRRRRPGAKVLIFMHFEQQDPGITEGER